MKKTRLQKNLILFTCLNILLIGFMAFDPVLKGNEGVNRVAIRPLITEISDIESKILDLEVIMIDMDKQIEKLKEDKTSSRNCIHDKLDALGNRKVGEKEIKEMLASCLREEK